MDAIAWIHSKEIAMVMRLIMAAILGGIVGIERGSGDRPAGLRTHILVCVGSALFMLVSIYGFDDFNFVSSNLEGEIGQRRDSARIAAQVVSGIGFLGAGTILHEGVTVRGLTTAASLWIVSAIGLAAGSGMYFISIVATFITMVTLVSFHNLEKRFASSKSVDKKFIRIIATNKPGAITDITGYLSINGVHIKSLNVKNDKEKNRLIVELFVKFGADAPEPTAIVGGLKGLEGVVAVDRIK